MKGILKFGGVLVLVAVVAALTVVPVAQSAFLSTTYYNIYWGSSTQYWYAYYLQSYLNRAFWAAKTTIGYDARLGKMNIRFGYNTSLGDGWMTGGLQDIYLSVPLLQNKSYEQWGSVVAHETAHVLFYNYTKADLWNVTRLPDLKYYRSFLTESLSWYCGDYVYYYYKNTRSVAYSHIKSYLQYYATLTGGTMNWWVAGYYYHNGTGNYFQQAVWTLKAAGWYLTGGRITGSCPALQKTLLAMRTYSSYSGSYLRSSSLSTAQSYFEYSFKYGYGRYANAGWIYTGSSNGAYRSTKYLYGSFWYDFPT